MYICLHIESTCAFKTLCSLGFSKTKECKEYYPQIENMYPNYIQTNISYKVPIFLMACN